MQIGRFPRKTILAATLLLAFSAANASFLEQVGSPPATTVAMTTYGVDVATRVGLKAVIPSGWQLFVHRSVELPESLSWKVEESWVSVLSNFAKANDIAVLVDWDKKSVYFRTTALALQEQEKRQMIAQAAATPLPSFKSDEPATAPAPAVAAAVVAAAPQSAAEKPVAELTAPAPAPVAVASAPAPEPVAVGTTEAKPPVVTGVAEVPKAAEPKASLLDRVLDAAAQPATVKPMVKAAEPELKAAAAAQVTPNAAAVNVDATKTAVADKVLETAAPKAVTPVVATVASEAAKPLETAVTPAIVAAPGAVMNGAAAQAALAVAAAVPAPTLVPASVPAAAPAPAYTEQVLAADKPAAEAFNRQSVDMVVRSAAEKHGYIVSWEAADVQFPGPVTILGADMGEDMRLVLRALGGRRSPVSIDVYRNSNVVRVRNASGTAEVAFSELPFQGAIREKSAPTFTVKVKPETAVLPTLIAAPAPVVARPAPVLVAAAPVAPVAPPVAVVTAPAPMAAMPVVPEPARLDTAVPVIKKLEDAAPMVATGTPAASQVSYGETETRPEPKPVVAAVVLRVERGEALHAAIEALLEPGWSLKWDVNGDMEANTALEVAGESLAAVLNKVLPRLALSADIYKPSKLVVIRPADAALDK